MSWPLFLFASVSGNAWGNISQYSRLEGPPGHPAGYLGSDAPLELLPWDRHRDRKARTREEPARAIRQRGARCVSGGFGWQ